MCVLSYCFYLVLDMPFLSIFAHYTSKNNRGQIICLSHIVLIKYSAELLVLHMQRICGGFGQNTSAYAAGEGMILGTFFHTIIQHFFFCLYPLCVSNHVLLGQNIVRI